MEFENLKKIPHSLEAERALIGGIFFNQDLFDEIKDIVSSDDFYKVEHSSIYKAIEKVYSDSKGIDAILVNEEIKRGKEKNKEEILEVFADIFDEITSSYNLLEYANLIKEKSMLRRLGNVGAKIAQLAYNDIRKRLSHLREELLSLLFYLNAFLKDDRFSLYCLERYCKRSFRSQAHRDIRE